MNARLWPLLALIAGLITLGFFITFSAHPTVQAAYELSDRTGVVSTFQRAETPADLAPVFGTPPDPAKIEAMDLINTLDLWGFIPAYSVFLIAAAIMIGGTRNTWVHGAILFALIGAVADGVETYKQLQVTADLSNAAAHLPIAPYHWAKYVALAMNGAALAVLCFVGGQRRLVLGILALAPLPLTLLSYAGMLPPRAFAVAFTLYWVALLVVAGVQLLKKRAA